MADLNNHIKILIIDKDEFFIKEIKYLLNSLKENLIFYHASCIDQAIEVSPKEGIDLILLELNISNEDSVVTLGLKKIHSHFHKSRIVIVSITNFISNVENDRKKERLRVTGVSGFISKSEKKNSISKTLKFILDSVDIHSETKQVNVKRQNTSNIVQKLEQLTTSEKNIINLIQQGYPNIVIADRLNVAIGTVKFHLSSIFMHLGVQNKAELVVLINNHFPLKTTPRQPEKDSELRDGPRKNELVKENKIEDRVKFSAFYTREITPERNYSIVIYTYSPDLNDKINNDVQKFLTELGGSIPRQRDAKSKSSIEVGTRITIVPESDSPDVEFEPPYLTKKWDGNWRSFLFDYEVSPKLIGEIFRFQISIQIAGLEIASIKNCSVEVIDSNTNLMDMNPGLKKQSSMLYQKIFVSYSHHDDAVTRQYKLAQDAIGNDIFIDIENIRTGENWKTALAEAIDEADVFQLFWSKNSATSKHCKYEWNYALNFRYQNNEWDGFIRPVYWEKPMPLPPRELSNINFKYVPFFQ